MPSRKKELFAKLLERWSLFRIGARDICLSPCESEYEFNYVIRPQLGGISKVKANELVRDHILDPMIAECVYSIHN